MSWDQKLRRLQENNKLSADELAATLGITPRTLSDFMRPGGREPTEPLQRLISLLLGDYADYQNLARKPKLNLVLIHGDFRVAEGQHPVDVIVNMHTAGGHNNEFHYVTVAPERDAKFALEALSRRRVQPHLFTFPAGRDTADARDCYFAVVATWLVAQATRRDLAHITLAADVTKFWPLARELKELAEVDVTVVREHGQAGSNAEDALRGLSGITIVDPVGRRTGVVRQLRSKETSHTITYGFIQPQRQTRDGELMDDGQQLFFSYNHMKKDPATGDFETPIARLSEGDVVSFGIGMNYKGPCAIDVSLVHRTAPASEPTSSGATATSSSEPEAPSAVDMVPIVRDAISLCAGPEGWALSSKVGARINSWDPGFKRRLQESGLSLAAFVATHPDVFEQSPPDGEGTPYSAHSMRLK